MPEIRVKKAPRRGVDPDEILYRFCYLFPQYTYKQAAELPYKRVKGMLIAAEREWARRMVDIVNANCAPHGKKGSATKLLDHYRKIAEG
jgi:hypothetical protein